MAYEKHEVNIVELYFKCYYITFLSKSIFLLFVDIKIFDSCIENNIKDRRCVLISTIISRNIFIAINCLK